MSNPLRFLGRPARVAAAAALVATSGGCILTQDLPSPALDLPPRYKAAARTAAERPPSLDWWRGFRSAELTQLIEEAQTVNLDIAAGSTIALVGRTGAGKSTVARLISRFYDPTHGRVLLDGYDLRELADDDLRSAIVAVTQESFLFEGTIAWNIGLGRPGATRREIEDAAKAIGAHDFIAALPQGYDTDVAKRGGRLSSGQKQLVSFARAFLADPKVLILDEATSSLDLPTERLVQAALDTLLADRTAVIIAHRLSTVEIADRVLVVEDGRIVADGPPGEVLPTLRIA